jgi:hypothetical protein
MTWGWRIAVAGVLLFALMTVLLMTAQHLVFRTDLRNGALDAYQRDPYTGEELKVSSKDWESAAILPGEELAFPPIYFLKSEFEAWLLNVSGRVRGRQTQGR